MSPSLLWNCAFKLMVTGTPGRIFVDQDTADLLEPGRVRVITYKNDHCTVILDVNTGSPDSRYWNLGLPRG